MMIDMVHEIFKKGDFPDDSVEERHFHNGCLSGFTPVGDNQYRFSMIRHPPIGPAQDRRYGLNAFIEVERRFLLDVEKQSIENLDSVFIRAEIDYDWMAETDAENIMDIYGSDIEKIRTRDEAVRFAKAESERLDWVTGLKDHTDGIEDDFPEFKFDWGRYLSTVKKFFISAFVEKWGESDHLKLVD